MVMKNLTRLMNPTREGQPIRFLILDMEAGFEEISAAGLYVRFLHQRGAEGDKELADKISPVLKEIAERVVKRKPERV